MKRGKLTEWQRRVALDIAQAFPLVATTPIRASGNHLVAAQDEPEPTALSEEQLLAGDLERNRRKAQRAQERNDHQAVALQQQHLDAMRRQGW